MWYRCDLQISSVEDDKYSDVIGDYADSEFFEAEDDKSAEEIAFELASEGIKYSDIGKCGLTCTYIAEVDDETETFEEKRVNNC